MYKIGVLGDRDSIYGFATLGLEVWPVATPEEGERALKEMAGTGYAGIYITESLYENRFMQVPELRRMCSRLHAKGLSSFRPGSSLSQPFCRTR